MRRIQLSVVRVFILTSCIMILPVTVGAAKVATIAEDWTLVDDSDASINYYTDSGNKVSVILFWATWCPYCRSLMPYIQELADEYKDNEVKFYALNVWEDRDPKRYFQKYGFTFHLMMRADLTAEDYGVKGTPALFVIDKSHRIIYVRKSGENDVAVKDAMQKAIEQALREEDPKK